MQYFLDINSFELYCLYKCSRFFIFSDIPERNIKHKKSLTVNQHNDLHIVQVQI